MAREPQPHRVYVKQRRDGGYVYRGTSANTVPFAVVRDPSGPIAIEDAAWEQWTSRLLRRMNLPGEWGEAAASLPHPWFLKPYRDEDELTDEEAAELFALVRPVFSAVVRRKVPFRQPHMAIPLLYAVRHIAREEGARNNLWPSVFSRLGERDVERLQAQGAQALTACWEGLYRASKGALYSPRDGRTYIKWPSTHAGLLRTDKEHLTGFWRYLRSTFSDATLKRLLSEAETERFARLLHNWVAAKPSYALLGLRRAMQDGDARLTFAALAQAHLLQYSASPADEVVEADNGLDISLEWDGESQHPVAVVEGTSASYGRQSLVFDGQSRSLPVAFRRNRPGVVIGPLRIQLLRPDWPSSATWTLPDGTKTEVLFAEGPGKDASTLLFDVDTGQACSRWRPGDEILLLTSVAGAEEHVRRAGGTAEVRATLGGAWTGFRTLQVSFPDYDGANETALAALASTLRLPEPRIDRRARLRLVGSVPHANRLHGPVFDRSGDLLLCVERLEAEPAVLELWRDDVRVSAARIDGRSAWVELAPPGVTLAAGTYTARLGSARLAFELRDVSPERTSGVLSISVRIGEAAAPQEVTADALAEAGLAIEAWPHAVLWYEVQQVGRSGAGRYVRADGEGRCSIDGAELQATLGSGPAEVRLSWRGAVTFAMGVNRQPHFVRPVRLGARGTVEVAPGVTGTDEALVLALLPATPWEGRAALVETHLALPGRVDIKRPPSRTRYLVLARADGTVLDVASAGEGTGTGPSIDAAAAWERLYAGLGKVALPVDLYEQHHAYELHRIRRLLDPVEGHSYFQGRPVRSVADAVVGHPFVLTYPEATAGHRAELFWAQASGEARLSIGLRGDGPQVWAEVEQRGHNWRITPTHGQWSACTGCGFISPDREFSRWHREHVRHCTHNGQVPMQVGREYQVCLVRYASAEEACSAFCRALQAQIGAALTPQFRPFFEAIKPLVREVSQHEQVPPPEVLRYSIHLFQLICGGASAQGQGALYRYAAILKLLAEQWLGWLDAQAGEPADHGGTHLPSPST